MQMFSIEVLSWVKEFLCLTSKKCEFGFATKLLQLFIKLQILCLLKMIDILSQHILHYWIV